MKDLKGNRIIISGLVSYKIELEELLLPIRKDIHELGGFIVGEHIQRRGVSRSRRPGGSKDLEKPLNNRTSISTGKVKELKELAKQLDCNLIIFINKLTQFQQENLEKQVEIAVKTFENMIE